MCKWGSAEILNIDGKEVAVDTCIAALVLYLNAGGYKTVASCCGHGKQPASIVLEGDREIRIMTFEQARQVDEMFAPIND